MPHFVRLSLRPSLFVRNYEDRGRAPAPDKPVKPDGPQLPRKARRSLWPAIVLPTIVSVYCAYDAGPRAPSEVASRGQGLSVTLSDCMPSSLITAISDANAAGAGPHTITLAANCKYTLTAANNNYYGPTGLPPIRSDIAIEGNGKSVIERSSAGGTPRFRLFYVSRSDLPPKMSGTLRLRGVTLRNGHAQGGTGGDGTNAGGGGGMGAGGAIFAHGSVVLSGVTIETSRAQGGDGGAGSSTAARSSGGGGGMGGNGSSGGGGGFQNAPGLDGGPGLTMFEGGKSAGGGGVDGSGAETGAAGAGGAGGAGGGARGLGGGGSGVGAGNAGDGGGGGGGGVLGGGGGGGFGGSGGDGMLGGGGGGFGGGGGSVAAGAGGGGGVGGGGGGSGDGGGNVGGGGGFGGGGGGASGHGGFGGGGGGGFPDAMGPGTSRFGGGSGGNDASALDRAGGGGGLGAGGAVFVHLGSLAAVNSTFFGNVAQGGSGGASPGTAGQGGSGLGGAVFSLNGTVQLTNVTISGNVVSPTGTKVGGAIYLLSLGAGSPGAAATLKNTIVANSQDGGGTAVNDVTVNQDSGVASIDVAVSNLIETALQTTGTPMVTGTAMMADPDLGALADNGGNTQTFALLATSPGNGAGDAATCSGSLVAGMDQRGTTRSPTACDLGAFEETRKNNGGGCAGATECTSGFCTDGVCCNSACGGGEDTDCQACSAAKKQSGAGDGTCGPAKTTVTCRGAAGVCDRPETCDGTTTACPSDGKFMGTVCRAKASTCDFAETCDGTNNACPTDRLAMPADMQLCRAKSPTNDCTQDTYCDGTAALCRVTYASAGTPCRRFTGGVLTGCGGTCSATGACTGTFTAPVGGSCP